ncbi:MAG TPA: response regulator [Candidatus Limnocylindria bacterium]|jgi:FixJ family two-component response regulator|nr:response regulator [Candidatus Limnocylindria bacterium]
MKPTQRKTKSIAIVDDDEDVRKAVHGVLKVAGLLPRSFASAEEFLGSGQRSETACLICDIEMPGMKGLDLQARLAEDGCRIPIIFITAYGDTRTRMRATKAGALDFLEKPFNDNVLLERIRAALGT